MLAVGGYDRSICRVYQAHSYSLVELRELMELVVRRATRSEVDWLAQQLRRETIIDAFRLAKELKHDIYGCIYLALAREVEASAIITTDTDFEKLCSQIGIRYENPVPLEVLKQFRLGVKRRAGSSLPL